MDRSMSSFPIGDFVRGRAWPGPPDDGAVTPLPQVIGRFKHIAVKGFIDISVYWLVA